MNRKFYPHEGLNKMNRVKFIHKPPMAFTKTINNFYKLIENQSIKCRLFLIIWTGLYYKQQENERRKEEPETTSFAYIASITSCSGWNGARLLALEPVLRLFVSIRTCFIETYANWTLAHMLTAASMYTHNGQCPQLYAEQTTYEAQRITQCA